jgi:hypothetical protein
VVMFPTKKSTLKPVLDTTTGTMQQETGIVHPLAGGPVRAATESQGSRENRRCVPAIPPALQDAWGTGGGNGAGCASPAQAMAADTGTANPGAPARGFRRPPRFIQGGSAAPMHAPARPDDRTSFNAAFLGNNVRIRPPIPAGPSLRGAHLAERAG